MMRTEIVDNLDRFLRLRPAWDDLLSSTETDHAFMKHVWFTEWIKAYECGDQLAVVTVWSDRQLVAAAPIRRTKLEFRGIRCKGLSFLWSPVAPRCNLMAAGRKYIEPLAEKLLSLPDWDILEAKNMESQLNITADLLTFLREHKTATSVEIEDGLQSPFMMTEGSFEDYWRSLPEKRRKHLERMCVRRLEKAGNSDISRVTGSDAFREFMPVMFEISGKSWKSVTNDHLRIDSPEGRFYAAFSPIGIDQGLVALYAIKIEGKVAGFEYLLSWNNRYSLIRSDFDEQFKYYAPGSNLRLAILRDLFGRADVCEYDLGGDPYPYKLEWCGNIRKHITLTVGGDSLLGKAVMLAKNKILPSLRKLGIGIPPAGRRR